MSEALKVEYVGEGRIPTIKEAWYAEEIINRQGSEAFETAQKLSSIVEEVRRSQATRELAEGLREALAEQTRLKEDLEIRFRELAEQWYMDTMPLSSYIEKILHPAYQKILVLGKGVVPFIMDEIRDMPNDWFWALRMLTDVDDPVTSEEAGNMQAMANAWLHWWDKEGPNWRAQNSL